MTVQYRVVGWRHEQLAGQSATAPVSTGSRVESSVPASAHAQRCSDATTSMRATQDGGISGGTAVRLRYVTELRKIIFHIRSR